MSFTNDELLYNSGVLIGPRDGVVTPEEDAWKSKRGGYVVIECPQRIPCNPCHTSCPTGAVKPFADINDVPEVDYSKCTGCSRCVAKCPGLACFVVDLAWKEGWALMKLPYEILPRPAKGMEADCLDRQGRVVFRSRIEQVLEPFKDRTFVVSVPVPYELKDHVRAVRVVE
ncbi:MAG TPA: 4Fe-4S dicluster domain-containing protein [Bacillota bacterium]|mgnify:FL=1|nr:4Fe-4S dicluster domain-containing protein [Bacillota bacterium]HOH09451.1 4Fe-4S dicluster domain-containing protein [Bacillota bacterium]HOS50110.1 4Fe-4S dicluster domain-containing protein [Bacillota bacterium]HOY89129.1 4Fe-4S dicluster domain-containing protein [Bacillota bacterium]HPI00968.1 4Fe-4S dicluster domain-containing protein [Bacillota bacterium]